MKEEVTDNKADVILNMKEGVTNKTDVIVVTDKTDETSVNDIEVIDIDENSEAGEVDIEVGEPADIVLEPEKELLFVTDRLPVGTVRNETQIRASLIKQNINNFSVSNEKSPRVYLDQDEL